MSDAVGKITEQAIGLSVIIPTLNDPLIRDVVVRISDELSTLAPERYSSEIIVVGRDEPRRLEDQRDIRFIDTQEPVGASVARNLGIQAATGEWILFVDSDCLVQPRWAGAMVERLAAGEDVVGGGVTFATNSYWPLVYNLSMFHEFLSSRNAREMRYLPTLNLAVKRPVIDDVGVMNEELKRGQDIDWTIRMVLAGYRLFFEPAAAVCHQPSRSGLAIVWRYWIRSGYYNSRNRQKYEDYYQTPWFLSYPWIMRLLSPLIAFIVTGRIFLRSPEYLKFLSTIPGIYMTKLAWCLGASMAEEPANS